MPLFSVPVTGASGPVSDGWTVSGRAWVRKQSEGMNDVSTTTDAMIQSILAEAGSLQRNLSSAALMEQAVQRGEGRFAANGALVVETGTYTGRSPKDKYVVVEPWSEANIMLGPANKPMEEATFQALLERVAAHLKGKELFVFDGAVGRSPSHQIGVQAVTELAWHNAFARNMLVRDPSPDTQFAKWNLIYAPGFAAVPERDGTRSEAFVILHFARRIILIGGTYYAGELKKSVFTVMNALLPERGVMPMHCSANVGRDGDVALFFGLSGTGKTTLSADPERFLIGDDEHGWSDEGTFNFEGGCYAKTIGLRREHEPEIWDAMRFGSVLENVVVDEESRVPDYDDGSLTENTRGCYPIHYIPGAVESGTAGHPKRIFFLTADAFGVLPPVARLDREQAEYYFLSGYTSKLAGTERGVTEPEATFSTAFGEPFLPLNPRVYAEKLGRRIDEYGAEVYLINTGWTGGPYGVGRRMELSHTRAMISAALNGGFDDVEFVKEPHFGLHIPTRCPGVPDEVLNPQSTWEDKAAYERQARQLAELFAANWRRFES